METAVASALAAAVPAKTDAGAAALCRRYAQLIDNAEPAARYAESIASVDAALETLAVIDPLVGSDYAKHWQKITEALAEHTVASDLGPKLLAALSALGLTVAGRGVKGAAPHGTPASRSNEPISEADRIAQQRATRAHRAGLHGA